MKDGKVTSFAAMTVTLALFFSYSSVQAQARSTGIGLRGTYWNMNNGPAQIIVTNHGGFHAVDVSNGGGWIFFFSRIDEQTFFEFSLGGAGMTLKFATAFMKTRSPSSPNSNRARMPAAA